MKGGGAFFLFEPGEIGGMGGPISFDGNAMRGPQKKSPLGDFMWTDNASSAPHRFVHISLVTISGKLPYRDRPAHVCLFLLNIVDAGMS